MAREENLDQQIIRQLLQDADHSWYKVHKVGYNYQEHLDFVAAYIVKHYNGEKRQKKRQ